MIPKWFPIGVQPDTNYTVFCSCFIERVSLIIAILRQVRMLPIFFHKDAVNPKNQQLV